MGGICRKSVSFSYQILSQIQVRQNNRSISLRQKIHTAKGLFGLLEKKYLENFCWCCDMLQFHSNKEWALNTIEIVTLEEYKLKYTIQTLMLVTILLINIERALIFKSIRQNSVHGFFQSSSTFPRSLYWDELWIDLENKFKLENTKKRSSKVELPQRVFDFVKLDIEVSRHLAY